MAKTPIQNGGKVKFDPPKVPVIFILGKKSSKSNKIGLTVFYYK